MASTNQILRMPEALGLPNNYLYISHLDTAGLDGMSDVSKKLSDVPKYWILPTYPDEISDTMQSNFQATNALGRSAPVYTYSNSGPRTVQISLALHRDIMDDLNLNNSSVTLYPGEDYVDALMRAIQAIALPKYNVTNNKMLEPPLVAVRLANELFIKGVVTGNVGINYKKPILNNNRYALVDFSFSISEVDPYDSSYVFKNGSFRGVVNTLKNGMGLN